MSTGVKQFESQGVDLQLDVATTGEENAALTALARHHIFFTEHKAAATAERALAFARCVASYHRPTQRERLLTATNIGLLAVVPHHRVCRGREQRSSSKQSCSPSPKPSCPVQRRAAQAHAAAAAAAADDQHPGYQQGPISCTTSSRAVTVPPPPLTPPQKVARGGRVSSDPNLDWRPAHWGVLAVVDFGALREDALLL